MQQLQKKFKIKEFNPKEAMDDLYEIAKLMNDSFKQRIDTYYRNFPIQNERQNGISIPFAEFMENEGTLGNASNNREYLNKIIEMIEKEGIMKLSTKFALYLLKKELKKFEDANKKYSLSSLEAEKFNF